MEHGIIIGLALAVTGLAWLYGRERIRRKEWEEETHEGWKDVSALYRTLKGAATARYGIRETMHWQTGLRGYEVYAEQKGKSDYGRVVVRRFFFSPGSEEERAYAQMLAEELSDKLNESIVIR